MKIICLIAVVIIVGGLFSAPTLEKKSYNNGICPKCGHPLRHFDNCSNGDELWRCDNCDYFTSVSYKHFVHRKKRKEDNQ